MITTPQIPTNSTSVHGMDYTIRAARCEEVDDVLTLFEEEVRAGRMLPRSPHKMRAHIDDWLVAEHEGKIIGCASLVFYNQVLCELRSLAVDPDYRGHGLGMALIRATLDLARSRNMRRVLSLTRAVGLFEKAGFRQDFIANFPQKVWRDCRPCPLRHRCDEVALIYDLDDSPSLRNGKRT